MLLIDDIAEQIESHPNAICLLAELNLTATTIKSFKTLFYKRFSIKIVKIISLLFDVKLAELYQRVNESLSIYYKRIIDLISRIEAKDRSLLISSAISFTILKSAMLDIILRAFIRELNNSSIR